MIKTLSKIKFSNNPKLALIISLSILTSLSMHNVKANETDKSSYELILAANSKNSKGKPSEALKKDALKTSQDTKKDPTSANNKTNKPNQEVIEACKLLNEKNYKACDEILTKAIDKNPNDIFARRYLAYSLLMQGLNEEAKFELLEINKLEKPTPFDWYLMGQLYYNTNELKLAQESFNNALYYNPYLYLARFNLIKCLIIQGEYSDALTSIDEGSKLTKNAYLLKYYKMLKDYIAKNAKAQSAKKPAKKLDSSDETGSKPESDETGKVDTNSNGTTEPSKTIENKSNDNTPKSVRPPILLKNLREKLHA